MKTFISIDPSSTACGWCVWRKGKGLGGWKPRWFGTVKCKKGHWVERVGKICVELMALLEERVGVTGFGDNAIVCLIEMPKVWDQKKASAVVKLAVMAGAVGGWVLGGELARRVEMVPVGKWKGQVKKEITQKRVLRRYGIGIGGQGCESVVDHNTIDAIGIGDWWARKRKR